MDASDRTADDRRAPTDSDRSPNSRHQIGRIHLAHEAPLRLGALSIEPALRRIAHDDGREEIVEPRVMQVLVALIRAGGQILTRNDLLMSCWHGVVVGEDAIDRVIGRLRRLAAGIGGGGFKLETITKVGYRLAPTDPQIQIVPSVSTPDAPPLAPAAAAEPLLAVLAFDNLCEGGDMAYFSDGVSEEILQTVGRAASVRVIGRSSSFQFRGADKNARHVAKELNATHVLDGSVRRSGSRVRVFAQLVECASQTTLWSDRFDRNLSDIFALQDEIAAAVAGAMKVVFAPTSRAEKISPAAYDLYLKALKMRTENVRDSVAGMEIVGLLERATALAPSFAQAWDRLACERAAVLRFGSPDQPYAIMRSKVVEAATTALDLDSGLGTAYQALAALEPFGHYARRERLVRQALTVAPRDPQVLIGAGYFSAEVGRVHDALSYAKHAFDLDPMYFWAAYTYASFLDFEGDRSSLALWDRFCDLWPESEMVLSATLAAAVHADWDRFDALSERARLVATGSERRARRRTIIWAGRNMRAADPHSLALGLESVRDYLGRTGTADFFVLTNLYNLGLTEEVFELIDRASFDYMSDPEQKWASGSLAGGVLFSLGHNGRMMRDPRFPRLCVKMGLCRYWVSTDRWPDCAEFVEYDFKDECRRLEAT